MASIPLKLLHESQGHVITVELNTSVSIRGVLVDAEDAMNMQLRDCILTLRNGQQSSQSMVYVRGSTVRFIMVPDMLKHAPMFKNKAKGKGVGVGRGKTTVARATAARTRPAPSARIPPPIRR